MPRARAALFTLLLAVAVFPVSAQDHPCGREAPCSTATGTYHLMPPPNWDGAAPLPAVIFYHGHNSSGASVFRSSGLKGTFSQNGYLVIAPNGDTAPGSTTRRWPARPSGRDQRDDIAFTLEVVADAAQRLPLIKDQIYVSGFSAGGSMAWMMACYEGHRFAGFASVAGALRRPNPAQRCPGGPVRLLQIHGFADTQVPFEGRGIRDWHQGDVFESLGLLRATNQCRSNPDTITLDTPFRCRNWNSCQGGALALCIHDGGHGLPKGWTDTALEWFEAPGERDPQ